MGTGPPPGHVRIVMIEKSDICFGPDSQDRLDESGDPSVEGALATLESFYYALNSRDINAVRADWSTNALAQLNNPVGGILRGGNAIVDLYERVFAGSVNVQVTFVDVVAYIGERHAVFAGREVGSYIAANGTAVPLEIRTSRYFRYEDGHWRQYHHHGSIDNPDALRAYQQTILG